jgi:hypothetical protein
MELKPHADRLSADHARLALARWLLARIEIVFQRCLQWMRKR